MDELTKDKDAHDCRGEDRTEATHERVMRRLLIQIKLHWDPKTVLFTHFATALFRPRHFFNI